MANLEPVNIMMNPEKWEECITLAERIPNECHNVSLALQPLMEGLGENETVYPYSKEEHNILDRQHHLYGKHIKWNTNFPVPRGAMRIINTDNNTSEISAPHRFISNKTNNWSGWHCYAGLENLIIDWDGGIFRGWCKQGPSIGNVFKTFQLPVSPHLCSKTFCHCNFDIMCKKEKNEFTIS